MNDRNRLEANGGRMHNDWWKYCLSYGERIVRFLIASVPFVFFSTLLEATFQQILWAIHGAPGGTISPSGAQGQMFSGASLLGQELASHGVELFAILLGCITILLLASLALMARVIRQD